MVQHRAEAAFPVLKEAATDLGNGTSDALGRALNLDDALGGLGKHFFGGDHACARGVLDGLDFEAAAADDGAHEVVRHEQAEGGMCARRGWRGCTRGGGGGLKELADDEGVCLGLCALVTRVKINRSLCERENA